MTWTTADLVNIDDQKSLVIFTVVFGRDDSQEQTKFPFVADATKAQVNAEWLARQATDYINKLNGIDTAKKAVQVGPIQLLIPPTPPTPDAAKVAYFAALFAFQALNVPSGMGEIAAAQPQRDILKKALEDGYKPEYFGQ